MAGAVPYTRLLVSIHGAGAVIDCFGNAFYRKAGEILADPLGWSWLGRFDLVRPAAVAVFQHEVKLLEETTVNPVETH